MKPLMARRLGKIDIGRLVRTKAHAWDWLMDQAREQGMQKDMAHLLNEAWNLTEPSHGFKN